jgi:hypothetical protein
MEAVDGGTIRSAKRKMMETGRVTVVVEPRWCPRPCQTDLGMRTSPDWTFGYIRTPSESHERQEVIVEFGRAIEVANRDDDVMNRTMHAI